MSYLFTPNLIYPLKNYKVNSYKFKQKTTYDKVFWGLHLGEDINCKAGTSVCAVGRGKVVYSSLNAKKDKKKNWGNIVVIAHKNPKTKKVFYSLYAHLAKRLVKKGNSVEQGKKIGVIGKANTISNGWWEETHLHFAVYFGEWKNKNKILPGYFRADQKRTKLSDWARPSEFIKKYAKIEI